MRFSSRLPRDTATLLLLAVFIIVLLGLSLAAHDPASHHVEAISTVGAVCLLVVYLAWVIPYLRSDTSPRPRTTTVLVWASARRSRCCSSPGAPRRSSPTGSSTVWRPRSPC